MKNILVIVPVIMEWTLNELVILADKNKSEEENVAYYDNDEKKIMIPWVCPYLPLNKYKTSTD